MSPQSTTPRDRWDAIARLSEILPQLTRHLISQLVDESCARGTSLANVLDDVVSAVYSRPMQLDTQNLIPGFSYRSASEDYQDSW